jgi:transcriptional regulator EpsA
MDPSRQKQNMTLTIVRSNGGVVLKERLPADTQVSRPFAENKGRELDSSPPAPGPHGCTAEDGEKFMRIIEMCTRIERHFEIFALMQGELQYFIPHRILISAWGDFRRGRKLTIDVISALPGLRTKQFASCNDRASECGMKCFLTRMHGVWCHGGRQPMLLNNSPAVLEAWSNCNCGLDRTLRNMKSILVHGVHDQREGYDSLYLALNPSAIVGARAMDRFCHLVDCIVPQIDFAFRRVAALELGATPWCQGRPPHPYNLTAREQQIMDLVCEGKTNTEIGAVLGISANTVKNHAYRIFPKLGVSNRTQAVGKYRQ